MEKNKKIIEDKEECLYYLKHNEGAWIKLDEISENLRKDPEIIELLITKNQNFINDFGKELIESPSSSKILMNLFDKFGSELFRRISPELKNNKDFMLKALLAYPDTYYKLPNELKKDMSFMNKCASKLETVATKYEKLGDKSYAEFVIYTKNQIEKDNYDNAKNTFGLDNEKYNLIKHYSGTIEKLCNIGSINKTNVFKICLENISSNKDLNLIEWTSAFNNLLNKFSDKEYEELLNNIEPQDIEPEKLNKILEQPNYFNIKSVENIKKYQEIKESVCDAIINEDEKTISNFPLIAKMDNIDRMKFAVLEKLMGYDLLEAQNISSKFLCVEKLNVKDQKDIKSWINSLKEIVNLKDIDVLKRLYSLTPVPSKAQDKLILEQEAKKLYVQEYNKTLFDPETALTMEDKEINAILPEGIEKDKYKFIDAGTNFNMIMTAIGAFSGKIEENFAQDWNQEIVTSTGVSCSYIGSDMIATAPIHNVCYGFKNMNDNSLGLAGDCDIYTCHGPDGDHNYELYSPNDLYVSYNTPENLKINTEEETAQTTGYNEMLFDRNQDGKRKQPDYLIVFKIGEQVKGLEKSCKVVDDFRKEGIELPIVVVDVERCFTNEMQKAEEMLEQAKNYKDIEQVENILKKNKKTVAFASRECRYNERVDTNIYREMMKKVWSKTREVSSKLYEMTKESIAPKVSLKSYDDSYQTTTVEERTQTASKIVALQKEIMRETQHKGGEIDGR